jgi:hypothetical protein
MKHWWTTSILKGKSGLGGREARVSSRLRVVVIRARSLILFQEHKVGISR